MVAASLHLTVFVSLLQVCPTQTFLFSSSKTGSRTSFVTDGRGKSQLRGRGPLHVVEAGDQNTDSVLVRDASSNDLGHVGNMLTEAFFSNNTNIVTYQIERLKTYLSLEDTFPQNGIADGHAMLVLYHSTTGKRPWTSYKKQKPIGFAEVDNRPVPATDDKKTTTPRPYMFNLVVDKRWKNRGMGTRLIQECERRVVGEWGETRLFLKVRRGNEPAIRLYEGLGYHVVDVLEQDNILVMKKDLNDFGVSL